MHFLRSLFVLTPSIFCLIECIITCIIIKRFFYQQFIMLTTNRVPVLMLLKKNFFQPCLFDCCLYSPPLNYDLTPFFHISNLGPVGQGGTRLAYLRHGPRLKSVNKVREDITQGGCSKTLRQQHSFSYSGNILIFAL